MATRFSEITSAVEKASNSWDLESESAEDVLAKDLVYIFNPELRTSFLDGSLTQDKYATYRRNTKRRLNSRIDRIARKYGYRGSLFSPDNVTVGVQGDGRTYLFSAAISGPYDIESLAKVSREITNSVHGVNRVLYVIQ